MLTIVKGGTTTVTWSRLLGVSFGCQKVYNYFINSVLQSKIWYLNADIKLATALSGSCAIFQRKSVTSEQIVTVYNLNSAVFWEQLDLLF